jgi:hypothetical protein
MLELCGRIISGCAGRADPPVVKTPVISKIQLNGLQNPNQFSGRQQEHSREPIDYRRFRFLLRSQS